MVKNVCVTCFKQFANKSNLNRHTETFHSSHVQPPVDEFDDPRQSSGLNGGGVSRDIFSDVSSVDAVSHSQCDENDDNQVDDFSQDDDQSTIDNVISTRSTMENNMCRICMKDFSNNSNLTRHVKYIHGDRVCGGGKSRDIFSDTSSVGGNSHSECDNNDDNQVDDFSQDDDQSTVDNVGSGNKSDDRSDDGSPHTSNDFYQLDIWSAINNWYGGKTGKQKLNFILNRLFKLTLLSRAVSRDDSCESITRTAEHFQDTFYMGCDEALEHAVLKRRFLIRDILAASAKEAENSMDDYASDNCMDSSDSSDGSDRGFDIWNVTNNKMDNENVSGDARTKRSLDLVLRCMRLVIAWCHDNIYKAIMITLKKAQVSKHMSFHKALKYAIHQNRYKIRKKLIEHDDDNESESDDDDKSECENDDSDETEYDNDDSNDESKSKI